MKQQLIEAISKRMMIDFSYGGYQRIVEPHIYGRHGGVEQLLVYQVGGGSASGGLPQWRRLDISRISGFNVRPEIFSGPRPTVTGQHSNWDEIFVIVT